MMPVNVCHVQPCPEAAICIAVGSIRPHTALENPHAIYQTIRADSNVQSFVGIQGTYLPSSAAEVLHPQLQGYVGKQWKDKRVQSA